jgi:hypothetical protein
MLVRDENGKIVIVSRSNCKNEIVYNEKLYNIRLEYLKKYKSVSLNPPKDNSRLQNQILVSKDFSDD